MADIQWKLSVLYRMSLEHPAIYLILFVCLHVFAGFVINVILSFRLNPLFDPKLRKYTEQYTDWVPSFTDRFLRAGFYANWVAKKEWFGRNRPQVLVVDFRTGLSKNTVRLCWIYTSCAYLYGLELLIGGIWLLLR
jgi:hypothetical protein